MAKAKKILIVVDVQNDFITDALRNEDAIKTLPNIVEFVKNEEFDETYVTMDTHGKNYAETLEGRKLPVPHCIKNTNGWKMPIAMTDALKCQNVVKVFEKDTFCSRELANFIRAEADMMYEEYKDCEFTIVGFCSDICVISNALNIRACFPNNKISVPKNCTAGVTKESNEYALLTMTMCQIDVV